MLAFVSLSVGILQPFLKWSCAVSLLDATNPSRASYGDIQQHCEVWLETITSITAILRHYYRRRIPRDVAFGSEELKSCSSTMH